MHFIWLTKKLWKVLLSLCPSLPPCFSRSTLHTEPDLPKMQIWSFLFWGHSFSGSSLLPGIQSSCLWCPVSSLISSPASLANRSPLPKWYCCTFPKMPCICTLLLLHSQTLNLTSLSIKTRFSGSPFDLQDTLCIFLEHLSCILTLLTIRVCHSHDNVNSLRKFICRSSWHNTCLAPGGYILYCQHIMREMLFCIASLLMYSSSRILSLWENTLQDTKNHHKCTFGKLPVSGLGSVSIS